METISVFWTCVRDWFDERAKHRTSGVIVALRSGKVITMHAGMPWFGGGETALNHSGQLPKI